MKNKLLIAMLLASLTLTACGNDQAKKTEDMAETKVEESAEEKMKLARKKLQEKKHQMKLLKSKI